MAKVLIGNFKGPKGDKGDKGDPGTAATIQVGTTQTVQPEANAEVTNTGTTSAVVLDFKIPRGADGMTDLTAEYKDASEYTCQPTVNAPVVVKELDGKTEHVETEGNQLFDIGVYKLITSRCNITQDGDYIIFKATDADAYFGDAVNQGQRRSRGTIPVSPNTEYTVTISNNYFTKNYISFLDSNKTGIQDYLNLTSQSQSFTTPDNCAYILLRFGNEFSVNGDTERLQIMLNKGSTALPWEPYTGGSPAPSPDYPQAIKGVGGMGYFDGTLKSVWYDSSGNPTSNINYYSSDKIECNAGDIVKVEYEQNVDALLLYYWNASGEYISYDVASSSNIIQKSAPANTKYFAFSVNAPNIGNSPAKYCTVTINGEYQTGVETQGRNLAEVTRMNKSQTSNGVTFKLNDDGSYTLNGTCIGNTVFLLNQPNGSDIPNFPVIFKFKEGTKYRITGSQITIRNPTHPNGTVLNAMSNDIFYTPTEDTDVIEIRALITQGTTYSSTKTYYPGIWEDPDETRTEWQPFKRTSITIPLTSPLYEGDKICYVKPGESYVNAEGETVVADGILYGCYRENAVVVFDGSEDEAFSEASGKISFRMNDKIDSFYGGEEYLKCDKLKTIATNISVGDMPENSIKESGTVGDNIVFIYINEEVNTVQLFRTWLQSNPLTVLYKLATPYFEPFPDQASFYNLRTDDTLSYVYSSDPIEPVLTVEVAKNSTGGYLLESYAQAQKNAISEANSQSRISAIEQQLVNQATTPTE